MNTNYTIDRSLLRFTEEVKAHFAFLEAKGFRCTRSEVTLVRFESAELAIDIYHGRQSYEISLQIENVRESDSYSFLEILRLTHNEPAEQYRDYATHTVEGVAEGVRRLAELFRKCVDSDILNDSELFFRLKQQRGEWAKSYALETQLEQARRKSESAWAEKKFGKVIEVLAPFQEHLNPSDLKKLEYAKKQIGI
jgi:hypothetical protein